MEPHLRDLRYFVAVAEELHFTNAAVRLGIAQPTLSRQIRQLETQLETTLFDRDQRSVALTVAGKELLEGARSILAAWNGISLRLNHAGETLRVGLQTAINRGLLNDLERGSGQTLEFHPSPWSDPTCGLATRKADLALVWVPPADERYLSRALRSELQWIIMPESHRLAESDGVNMVDLLDEPFIALPPEAGALRDYWLATYARDGRPVVVGAEADTAEEKIEAIEHGLGICLIAEGAVPLYRWPGIVARPVLDLAPCELSIAWRVDDDRDAVRDFVSHASGR
jgi:DNA-binding transcriptional LysR family regulator